MNSSAILSTTAITKAGAANPAFGNLGRIVTDLGADDGGRNLIQLADGKFVVVGVTQSATGGQDWAIARYNPDGSLDTSFGTNGTVTTPNPASSNPNAVNNTVFIAAQPDGRLIVAGQNTIRRYTATGQLDNTFGIQGLVDTGAAAILNLALQTDGQVVISGSQRLTPAAADEPSRSFAERGFALQRYSIDGQLDTTFGNQGTVLTVPSNETIFADAAAYGVTIQDDGKIIAVGSTPSQDSFFDIAIARYNTDGSLDASFGNGGTVVTQLTTNFDAARSVAVQPDGKIVVGGYADGTIGGFALVRYNPDGSLDNSFGNDGSIITQLDNTNRRYRVEVALQDDGNIILVGTTTEERVRSQTADADYEFAILRYTPDGQVDPSFGEQGIVQTNPSTGVDAAYDVVIDPQGNIVIAGESQGDFVIASYLGTAADVTPPDVPTIQALIASTGRRSDNLYTNDPTPLLEGTAEANSSVSIFRDDVLVGSTNADASGLWSFQSATLADGVYNWTVQATDAAGNRSGISADQNRTIDTLAPSATVSPNFSLAPAAVTGITLEFSESIGATGLTLSDLELNRNGQLLELTSPAAFQLSSSDGQTWILESSGNELQVTGCYRLGIAAGAMVSDRTGNPLTGNPAATWGIAAPSLPTSSPIS